MFHISVCIDTLRVKLSRLLFVKKALNVSPGVKYFVLIAQTEFTWNTNRNSSVAYLILNGWPKGILWWNQNTIYFWQLVVKMKGSNWRELSLIRQRTMCCPKAWETNYVAGTENTQTASLNHSLRSDSSISNQVKPDMVSDITKKPDRVSCLKCSCCDENKEQ